jgi:molybdate transport system regulatory protein
MTSRPLQLSQALGHEATDKRIDILRRIGAGGSISEAARAAGVSYKAAWQAVETLSNLAGQDLVDKAVGGAGGGGARLTAAGERLLQVAERLSRLRAVVLASGDDEAPPLAAPWLVAVGLRTSMRNQLPCTVRSVSAASPSVRVELALADGSLLASRITAESAELLGLHAGLPLVAMCKATAVSVARTRPAAEGVNRLRGTVTRRSTPAAGGEVALRLGSGARLVGFAAAGSGVVLNRAAEATVDESAVVLVRTD